MPNRLAQESSLYLKQHADNPVDWYAWGPEAFEKARSENKLIHLSVGYSSCHWCHVMAHECFENPGIAAVMNERFINIKVDREERPDVDAIYQNVAQIFTQGGGWPLTVFMLPDGRPVYGGTYFPPEDKYGRPGFPKLLLMLSEVWDSDRPKVLDNASRIHEVMEKIIDDEFNAGEHQVRNASSISDLAAQVRDLLLKIYDDVNGGFGNAPKFPNTMGLTLLWRMGERRPVVDSLLKMINGGLFDQLGGGFHRYSVDANWSVPHFEKMLYDQALLVKLISEALCTQEIQSVMTLDEEKRLRQAVVLTLEYLNREMKSEAGLYFTAQDADTVMGEGFNFVWDQSQVREAFSDKRDAELFIAAFRVREGGNFEHGKTVLSRVSDLEELALRFGEPPTKLVSILERVRKKGFEARESRVKPLTDQKILAGINGLMLSALSWSYGATRDPAVKESAVMLANELYSKFWDENTKRLSSIHYGVVASTHGQGFFSDYAFVAKGLVDLCRILPSDDSRSLRFWNWSRELTEVASQLFRERKGEWSETSQEHETLLFKPKSTLDGSSPASIAVWFQCALANSATLDFSLEEELSVFAAATSGQLFSSGELALTCLDFIRGLLKIKVPGEYIGYMHPRAIVEPDTTLKISQYCKGQTCFPYEGIETVRRELSSEYESRA